MTLEPSFDVIRGGLYKGKNNGEMEYRLNVGAQNKVIEYSRAGNRMMMCNIILEADRL
jgi:hypothetical protein